MYHSISLSARQLFFGDFFGFLMYYLDELLIWEGKFMEILETDRLILRGWKECDLYDFYEYAKEPGVGPAAGWKPHENIEESQRILNDFIKKQQVWALFLSAFCLLCHNRNIRTACSAVLLSDIRIFHDPPLCP